VRHGADKHRAVVLETMKTRSRWSLRALAAKTQLGHWTLARTIHALVREGAVLASGATNSREFRLP
jgi:lambda repressor-like predicted transcriptional regulator